VRGDALAGSHGGRLSTCDCGGSSPHKAWASPVCAH
jgi:hypothetical protein